MLALDPKGSEINIKVINDVNLAHSELPRNDRTKKRKEEDRRNLQKVEEDESNRNLL